MGRGIRIAERLTIHPDGGGVSRGIALPIRQTYLRVRSLPDVRVVPPHGTGEVVSAFGASGGCVRGGVGNQGSPSRTGWCDILR